MIKEGEVPPNIAKNKPIETSEEYIKLVASYLRKYFNPKSKTFENN